MDGSDVISIRGEAVVAATARSIFEIMQDNRNAHKWIPLVSEKRDLEQVSDSERIEYTRIEMPWPMTDRYFINIGKVEHLDAGKLRIYIKSVERPGFEDNGNVRGILHYSEFILTPVQNGAATHLTFEVNSDPKGLIPKWLVNRAQRTWPEDFFKGLNEQLARRGNVTEPPLAH